LGQDEQKIQDEQKYLEEQEAKSTIPSEKKSLEQRRAEIEAGRQEREKSRWAVEKEQEDLLKKMRDLDYELQMLSTQKNTLLSRIKTIDETLRNIYSGVITREETRRMGQAEDQKKMQEQTAKMQAVKKEEIRKEQWARQTGGNIPAPVKKPVINSFAKEEEQRRQFIKDINQQTHE